MAKQTIHNKYEREVETMKQNIPKNILRTIKTNSSVWGELDWMEQNGLGNITLRGIKFTPAMLKDIKKLIK